VDLRPTDEQAAVIDVFAALGERWCSTEEVRRHEELGFSPELWARVVATGAPGMAVPSTFGGADAGLLDLALAVEQLGRRLAPVPLVEHAVAARLLARLVAPEQMPEGLVEGAAIATVALRPAIGHLARLVPAGAVARHVVARDGDELVLATSDPPEVAVTNLGSAPLADRAVGGAPPQRLVLASGPDAPAGHDAARTEWRVLTAASLVGLGAQALEIGREYVSERHQFGVPIGSFQAIQHGLADCKVGMDGARLLARKAAWAVDHELPEGSELASMAFLFAAEQAQATATHVLHCHGGYGFMEEYDIQLYYRRAKAWALVLDEPAREYQHLADLRYVPAAV
jgi:alkylation response protein AidB-like acyl-CoA dehydrogenase